MEHLNDILGNRETDVVGAESSLVL